MGLLSGRNPGAKLHFESLSLNHYFPIHASYLAWIDWLRRIKAKTRLQVPPPIEELTLRLGAESRDFRKRCRHNVRRCLNAVRTQCLLATRTDSSDFGSLKLETVKKSVQLCLTMIALQCFVLGEAYPRNLINCTA
jgi:hypothetical protein